MDMNRWLDELVRKGVVRRREDVINSLIVLGCIVMAAGIALLVLALSR